MKNKLQLWFKRWAIRTLIKLVDRAEERLQAWQVSLRNHLSGRDQLLASSASLAGKTDQSQDMLHRAPARSETFLEWEARKSGIAVVSKKEARRRRERTNAAAFDLRFAPEKP
jgi:hypothetical protein